MGGVELVLPCELKVINQETEHSSRRKERSISKEISFSGAGLFSGIKVNMTLKPGKVSTGIVFKRVDLPGKPIIPAHVDYILGTPRCTILGKGNVVIQSVEHILSALSAFNIDNLEIELDGMEVPVGDGSALPFARLLEEVELIEQDSLLSYHYLDKPVYFSDGKVQLVALPSKTLQFSYTLSYPGHPILKAQFHTFEMSQERYIDEIAPCRTFSLYEEILPLLEKGIIKGGTLANGVVINGSEILNPEGLRFQDEMVRHKMLDLIGDLSLMGIRVVAHFIAIRSGHFSNTELAKRILARIKGGNN
jgi:UDP-3-O-[3-hydroxymyristoyl] N-acetylglucosamine deacetylase